MAFFMGIDIGTQNVRCGIQDETGRFLALHEENCRTLYPRPGYAEQIPGEWIDGFEKLMFRCRKDTGNEKFARIAGITVCATASTASTVVPVKDGQPLSKTILWMDNRAAVEAARINATGHAILKHCGGESSVE
jgi:ribulose kinase